MLPQDARGEAFGYNSDKWRCIEGTWSLAAGCPRPNNLISTLLQELLSSFKLWTLWICRWIVTPRFCIGFAPTSRRNWRSPCALKKIEAVIFCVTFLPFYQTTRWLTIEPYSLLWDSHVLQVLIIALWTEF